MMGFQATPPGCTPQCSPMRTLRPRNASTAPGAPAGHGRHTWRRCSPQHFGRAGLPAAPLSLTPAPGRLPTCCQESMLGRSWLAWSSSADDASPSLIVVSRRAGGAAAYDGPKAAVAAGPERCVAIAGPGDSSMTCSGAVTCRLAPSLSSDDPAPDSARSGSAEGLCAAAAAGGPWCGASTGSTSDAVVIISASRGAEALTPPSRGFSLPCALSAVVVRRLSGLLGTWPCHGGSALAARWWRGDDPLASRCATLPLPLSLSLVEDESPAGGCCLALLVTLLVALSRPEGPWRLPAASRWRRRTRRTHTSSAWRLLSS